MKPSLGRTVYCIYEDLILVETVYMVGKDSFLIDSFGSATKEDSWEWYYDQYNVTWFTSLARAKKAIMKSDIAKHYVRPVLVKVIDYDQYHYYELREKEVEKPKWTTVNT